MASNHLHYKERKAKALAKRQRKQDRREAKRKKADDESTKPQ